MNSYQMVLHRRLRPPPFSGKFDANINPLENGRAILDNDCCPFGSSSQHNAIGPAIIGCPVLQSCTWRSQAYLQLGQLVDKAQESPLLMDNGARYLSAFRSHCKFW